MGHSQAFSATLREHTREAGVTSTTKPHTAMHAAGIACDSLLSIPLSSYRRQPFSLGFAHSHATIGGSRSITGVCHTDSSCPYMIVAAARPGSASSLTKLHRKGTAQHCELGTHQESPCVQGVCGLGNWAAIAGDIDDDSWRFRRALPADSPIRVYTPTSILQVHAPSSTSTSNAMATTTTAGMHPRSQPAGRSDNSSAVSTRCTTGERYEEAVCHEHHGTDTHQPAGQ